MIKIADLSLATKILGVFYKKHFEDYGIGFFWNELDTLVEGDKNEISKAIKLLESNSLITHYDGEHKITTYGIDKYEETLAPSTLNKRSTERKMILQILKEMYDKDTDQEIDNSELATKIKNDGAEELYGQIKYLEDSGLVECEHYSGGFSARLTASGASHFEKYEKHDYQIMSAAYRTLFILENQLRDFIERKLTEGYGSEWWKKGVSQGLKAKVDDRKRDESSIPWQVSKTKTDLEYLSFPDLGKIITNQWDLFKEAFKNQDQIDLRLKELEEVRNAIAHSRTLTSDAFTRLEQYNNDICKLMR